MAFRYFRSHGPTSAKDFAGWTGLSVRDAKTAVANNHDRLYEAQFRGQCVFMTTELADAIDDGVTASRLPGLALPGFDEFVLGYKDRTVQIADEHKNHIIPGGNGIFRSTFSVDGTVIATWKRAVKKSRVVIELMPFEAMSAKQVRDASQAFKPYGEYLGLSVTVQVSPP